jgi:hypothetical protein
MSAITSIPTSSNASPWTDDSVAIAAARDVSRRHGSGDAAVDALRGVSLALYEATSSPSWVRPARASRR